MKRTKLTRPQLFGTLFAFVAIALAAVATGLPGKVHATTLTERETPYIEFSKTTVGAPADQANTEFEFSFIHADTGEPYFTGNADAEYGDVFSEIGAWDETTNDTDSVDRDGQCETGTYVGRVSKMRDMFMSSYLLDACQDVEGNVRVVIVDSAGKEIKDVTTQALTTNKITLKNGQTARIYGYGLAGEWTNGWRMPRFTSALVADNDGDGIYEAAAEPDFTVKETPVEGWTANMESAQVVNEMSGGDSSVWAHAYLNAKFVNTWEGNKEGNLRIQKTVTTGTPGSIDFTVNVTLTGQSIDKTPVKAENVTGTYGDVTFNQGKATVKIKAGQTVTATGLPAGLTYQVTETNLPKGWEQTSIKGDTGTIPTDDTASVSVTNQEIPRQTGNLKITKTVPKAQSDITGDTEFTMNIALTGQSTDASPVKATDVTGTYGNVTFDQGKSTVKIKTGETVNATGLPAGLTYQVTETDLPEGWEQTSITGDTGTIPTDETASVNIENSKRQKVTVTINKRIAPVTFSGEHDEQADAVPYNGDFDETWNNARTPKDQETFDFRVACGGGRTEHVYTGTAVGTQPAVIDIDEPVGTSCRASEPTGSRTYQVHIDKPSFKVENSGDAWEIRVLNVERDAYKPIIKKVDENGKPVAGAVFHIYGAGWEYTDTGWTGHEDYMMDFNEQCVGDDMEKCADQWQTVITDENGYAYSEYYAWPWRIAGTSWDSYVFIEEESAPDGYIAWKDSKLETLGDMYKALDDLVSEVWEDFCATADPEAVDRGKCISASEYLKYALQTDRYDDEAKLRDLWDVLYLHDGIAQLVADKSQQDGSWETHAAPLLEYGFFDFDVDDWSDEPFTITVVNQKEPAHDIHISKTDVAGEELAGAILAITGKDRAGDEVSESWQSDGSTHTVALRPGEYTLTETQAPLGFDIAENISFTVDGEGKVIINGAQTDTIVMVDAHSEHEVTVSKRNLTGASELAGAKFKLTGTSIDGKPVNLEWTSSDKAETLAVQPGEYTLTEVEAPAGYDKTGPVTVTVTSEGVVMTSAETVTGKSPERELAEAVGWVFADNNPLPEVIKNSQSTVNQGSSDYIKNLDDVVAWREIEGTSNAVDGGQAYKGYVIAVNGTTERAYIDYDGNAYGGLFAYQPNQCGTPEVDRQTALGAANYMDRITCGLTNTPTTVVIRNTHTVHEILVSKQDVAGQELAGAELSVTGTDVDGGEVSETWTSDGSVHKLGLKPGEYTLTENQAPLGYDIAESIVFVVAEDGTVTVKGETVEAVVMVDELTPVAVPDAEPSTQPTTVAPTPVPSVTQQPAQATLSKTGVIVGGIGAAAIGALLVGGVLVAVRRMRA